MRLRLLPILVLTASLALTVRLGDLWRGVDGMALAQGAGTPANAPVTPSAATPAATPANATPAAPQAANAAAMPPATPPATQPATPPAASTTAATPPPAAPASAKPATPAAATPAQAAAAGTTSSGTAAAPAAQQAQATDLPTDPLLMTDEEISLLQDLAERRRVIDQRARDLADREALLQAAQLRIEEKVNGLEALKKSIESLLKQQEGQTESQYQSLVKIYENMKPKDAARIFEQLEMAVLIPVVERMKERKTAPILAKMNPVKAQEITVRLAERRNQQANAQPPAQK